MKSGATDLVDDYSGENSSIDEDCRRREKVKKQGDVELIECTDDDTALMADEYKLREHTYGGVFALRTRAAPAEHPQGRTRIDRADNVDRSRVALTPHGDDSRDCPYNGGQQRSGTDCQIGIHSSTDPRARGVSTMSKKLHLGVGLGNGQYTRR
ncbi:MAG TPA: hypothetical protein VKB59_05420 [Micromonosporaceae bacterium]|nr:hypothetical protein [Micromonosporaceae bacterium]